MCSTGEYPETRRTDANEVVDTIKSILMCIQSRVEGTIEMYHIIWSPFETQILSSLIILI